MSRNVIQPMDSYRLAQYIEPALCFLCEAENPHDAEFCSYCHAPIALAHQAEHGDPRLIATIGSADAGKTVYLGMLADMLSRWRGGLQLLARGAFSITLQQSTMAALSQRRFPEKTPNEPDRWNWVHCQVRWKSRRNPLDLIMPDMAGDAVMQEMNHPQTYKVIREFLDRCSAVMVLVDAAKLHDGEQEQDFFTMKILSYLCELDDDRRTGWPNRPIAVIFTKSDECDSCFEDPDAFASRHASGTKRFCEERLTNAKFFAASVAGACAQRPQLGGYQQAPIRVEPRGVVEPFFWISDHLH